MHYNYSLCDLNTVRKYKISTTTANNVLKKRAETSDVLIVCECLLTRPRLYSYSFFVFALHETEAHDRRISYYVGLNYSFIMYILG